MPSARYCAVVTSVRRRSTSGSCGTVIACRSTTQKNASNSSCNATQWVTAPSALPRCSESEVGWTPEKTRFGLVMIDQSFHAAAAHPRLTCGTGGNAFIVATMRERAPIHLGPSDGSGEPMVLLHPFMMSQNVWKKVAPPIADTGRYEVLAPTM